MSAHVKDPQSADTSSESKRQPPTLSATAQRFWRERTLGWRESVTARVPLTASFFDQLDAISSVLPPGWPEKLPFLLLALLFSPRAFFTVALIAGSVMLGYVWAESAHGKSIHGFTDMLTSIVPHHAPIDTATPTSPTGFLRDIEPLVDHIMRDFIDNWFQNINHSRSPAFPQAVREALEHGFLKLKDSLSTTRLTPQIILPVFQRVIAHLREYRALEASTLGLAEYQNRNPKSPFNAHRNRDDVISHLRVISMLLAVELLPRADKSSPVVFEFANEILATSVLLPIVEMCSDPDWINQQLVSYLKRKQKKAAAKAAKAREGPGPAFLPGATVEDEIYVKVLEARKLPLAGVNDLYCSVLCGTQVQKGKKTKAESNPMWMEEFRFPWKGTNNSGIDGVVVDVFETKLIKDDILGSVYIPMDQLPPNQLVRGWRPVDTSDSRFSSKANAEILIEAIRIRPTAYAEERIATPQGSINATDIMVRNHAFVEFMEYMDTIQSSRYVQLYIMMDSFNRFAQLEMAGQTSIGSQTSKNGLKADALSIIDTFLVPAADQYVDLSNTDVVKTVQHNALENPNPDMFKPVQAAVIRLIDERFLHGFEKSTLYLDFCAREGGAGSKPLSDSESVKADTQVADGAMSDSTDTVDASLPPVTDLSPLQQVPSVGGDSSVESGAHYGPSISIREATDCSVLPPDVHSNAVMLSESEDHNQETQSLPTTDSVESPLEHSEEARIAVEALGRCAQSAADVLGKLKLDGTDSNDAVQDAINSLREQVVLIDAVMRQAPDSESVADLANVKLQLQTKVEELTEMTADDHPLHHDDDNNNFIDLRNIRINVLDMSDGEKNEDTSTNIFAFAGVGTNPNPRDMRYIIQIERTDGSGGWMITKSYADLIALNEHLETAFSKVKKSGFPTRTRVSVNFSAKAREHNSASSLSADLERWLNIIITDAELCQSKPIQDFMRPENFQAQQDMLSKSQMQTKVLGSLKSAGTLLRKVAVATPLRAANFVAGEVNAAVAGVTQGVKRATTINNPSTITNPAGQKQQLLPRSQTQPTAITAPAAPPALPSRTSHDDVRFLPRASSLEEITPRRKPVDADDAASHRSSSDQSNTPAPPSPHKSDKDHLESRFPQPPTPAPRAPLPSLATRLERPTQHHLSPTAAAATTSAAAAPSPLSDADLEIVLECLFGTIEEIFALSDPAQWFRQKGLHMVKTILRRTYGAQMSFIIQTRMHEATSEKKIATYFNALDASLWPSGTWYASVDNPNTTSRTTTTAERNDPQPPPQPLPQQQQQPQRTDQTMADTKMEAKQLFLASGNHLPGLETVARVVGKFNTHAGITRLFNMLQNRDLNRHLICEVVERIVRGLLET
ncbi:hypothetical protein PhCBS80983_g04783 [Powellomyces hirtus]|uniref:C2 domain-containing protein n=1 Tax=Powellomyces hirtus TaxID=109895 RepID=A0A507DYR7_9FUNG|nr:hypothetical protein PhCBS80983_g04783 [Powellomyces hirtus]